MPSAALRRVDVRQAIGVAAEVHIAGADVCEQRTPQPVETVGDQRDHPTKRWPAWPWATASVWTMSSTSMGTATTATAPFASSECARHATAAPRHQRRHGHDSGEHERVAVEVDSETGDRASDDRRRPPLGMAHRLERAEDDGDGERRCQLPGRRRAGCTRATRTTRWRRRQSASRTPWSGGERRAEQRPSPARLQTAPTTLTVRYDASTAGRNGRSTIGYSGPTPREK